MTAHVQSCEEQSEGSELSCLCGAMCHCVSFLPCPALCPLVMLRLKWAGTLDKRSAAHYIPNWYTTFLRLFAPMRPGSSDVGCEGAGERARCLRPPTTLPQDVFPTASTLASKGVRHLFKFKNIIHLFSYYLE